MIGVRPTRRHLQASLLIAALLALAATPAAAQVQVGLDSILGDAGLTLNLGGRDFELDADDTLGLPLGDGGLKFTVALAPGYALTGIQCTGGVAGTVAGTTVTLSGSPDGETLASCVLAIVDVAGAAVATFGRSVAIRAQTLLSSELGFNHQLDRFPGMDDDGTGEWSQSAAIQSAPNDENWGGSMMGLTNGNGAAPLAFSASSAKGRPGARQGFNLWSEGYIARFEDDVFASSDGHLGVFYAGVDYLVTPRLLVGALVQYDALEQKFDSHQIRFRDSGWMAGPYMSLRLSDTVFFQSRAAWGQTENEFRVGNAVDDNFDSERWLVKGKLLANWRSGDWLLRPSASIAYLEEDQDAYLNSMGVAVAAQSIAIGQAKAGPELSYHYHTRHGLQIVPSLSAEAIWNFHEEASGSLLLDDFVTSDAVRGRLEAGLAILATDGLSIGASATYDGVGDGDFHAIGGRARVKVPLN